MKESYLGNEGLPLIIEPDGSNKSKAELLHWLNTNKDAFSKKFYESGAVLFRGFDIDTPLDFETVALQVDPGLKNDYYGTSPRNIV